MSKTLPPLVPSLVTFLLEVDKTHLEYGWHWLLHREPSSPSAPVALPQAGVRNPSQRARVFAFGKTLLNPMGSVQ